ncbi:hypothetical protein HDU86_007664 [Geranomyces michiganensis]|nr:hypothetical protein HDU86_007664 [Geranomyces michiganensis]
MTMPAPQNARPAAKRSSTRSKDSKPQGSQRLESKADTAEWAARRLEEVMMARLGLGGGGSGDAAAELSVAGGKKRKAKAAPADGAAKAVKKKSKKLAKEEEGEEGEEEKDKHASLAKRTEREGKLGGNKSKRDELSLLSADDNQRWLDLSGAESENEDDDGNLDDYYDEDEDEDEDADGRFTSDSEQDFQSDDEFSSRAGGLHEVEDDDDSHAASNESPTTSSPNNSTSNEQSTAGPQVIVFQDAARAPPTTSALLASTNTKAAYRAFMSSSIKKQTTAAPRTKLSAREAEQEQQDQQHDRDLAELLRDSKLVEQFTRNELTGADRRAHMREQVVALGGKPAKLKVPRNIQMGMDVKERARGAQRLQEAKDLGTYHSSLKTQIMGAQGQKDLKAKTDRIKERVKHRSRGIDGGFGSFRNGTLHIGKDEMERVEKMGKPARGGGGGGGRGRGGGGGRGGRGRGSSGKKPTKIRR